jgi:hypothetical protein
MCEKHTWKAKEVHKTAIMGTAHIFWKVGYWY